MTSLESKILQFVISISPEEPLDGSEVTKIARQFVRALCTQHGEADQIPFILRGKKYAAARLINRCADIYEKGDDGQTAVLDYCRNRGHKHWGWCEDCEYISPYVVVPEGVKCLVCSFGTITREGSEQDEK